MAPRKTAAGDKAPKAPVTKKSANKVIKRPARGYHKFRNGLLNVTPKAEPKNATALLRTCRQIYSETAIMPLALTVFSISSVQRAKRSFGRFKLRQRKQITILQFDIVSPESVIELTEFFFVRNKFMLADSLPALQELRVEVYSAQDPIMTREKTEEAVHEYLEPSIREMSVEVKVHQTNRPWSGR
ncbi:hypothetical protein J4E85_010187 [Alternaria conjuncta]|uniref:uncharacterized protein n=1 Tax=Alternaria conjuncta TaxID=181017 RepID=UPI002220B01B|nr:uncharacterized protein J4E85_010187 [Alternaria conjuncta]KAI4916532.1 hypothetical protein J4E85_010187 [Alternaria conjuncta]